MKRAFILVSLGHVLALSALAQTPTPPSGFSIQITPSDSTRGAALQPAAPGEAKESKKTEGKESSHTEKTSSAKSQSKVKATSNDQSSPVGARLRLDPRGSNGLTPDNASPPKDKTRAKKKRRQKTAKKSKTKKRRKAKARADKKRRLKRQKVKKRRKRKAHRKSTRRADSKKRRRKSGKKSRLDEPVRVDTKTQTPARPSMSKRDIKRALKSVKAQLSGTGAPYGERSRWGMIETLPMRVIAQIRQFVTGPEQTFDANFDFIGLTTNLDEDSQLKLIALADMLRENQAIYLAVIEGQANQFGNPEEDQILSRARASAVRELLIKRGIATERVVAYGIGNALTSAHRKGKSTHTKPITIRYYEGKPRQRLAATRWDELAIVKHEGHVEHIVDGRKHQLEERSQIPANGIVRLQAGSRVLLRAPDGSTIFLVGPSAIEFIEGSFSGPVKRLDARLLEGEVIVRNDPSRSRKSQFSLSFGRHHHLAAGSTTFRAGTDGVRLWLTIDKGRVQLKRTKGDTLTLGDGQSYLALESARTVWPQKPEPMVLGLGGSQKKGRSTLRWKGAAPDTGYRVEFADSADFTWVVARKVITANELNIDETIPKAAKFWRVARIDERGIPGRFSAVYPIETPLRYQNAKP